MSKGAKSNVSLSIEQSRLRELGHQVGTDKVTHHRYDRFYSRFLEPLRAERDGAMLEIGIQEGKSLKLWLEYFSDAFVYGIDVNISAEGERFKIFKADQSDLVKLKEIATTQISKPVFLIIDDGSHLPEHQALSFDFLFDHLLVEGGVYIIEDIEVSYWTQGGLYGYETRYGYRHPLSIIEIFRDVLDDLNQEFLTPANRNRQNLHVGAKLSPQTRAKISSIQFAKNCIIITKKTAEEMAESTRAYRYAGKL